MKSKVLVILTIIVCVTAMGLYLARAASTSDIPRMTVEDLKKLLDDPKSELIIIDVRTGSSWSKSELKIKTAVREDPEDFNSWAKKHPKEKTIVLYCT
jgi:rhodanese-related sulfurtransferase